MLVSDVKTSWSVLSEVVACQGCLSFMCKHRLITVDMPPADGSQMKYTGNTDLGHISLTFFPSLFKFNETLICCNLVPNHPITTNICTSCQHSCRLMCKFWLQPLNQYLDEKKLKLPFNLCCVRTRQIWGIWKLRPAYSPETPNLGQNRWCFVPCDLEIWWMTLENNRASLICCFKLCATFHSHRWMQTGVTVQKRPIWVKLNDF